jgi:hypothetical protein
MSKKKSITLFNQKEPDLAADVFDMFKKVQKSKGFDVKEEDYLEHWEYFDLKLNADGTWELV